MRCALAVGMMAAVLSFASHAQERGGSSTSESAQAQSNGPDRSGAPSRAGSTATTVPRVPPVAALSVASHCACRAPPGPLSGLPGGMRPGGNSGFPMSPSETMSLPGQPSQPFSPPPPSSVPSPVMSLPSVPASPPASAPPTSSTSCPRDQRCSGVSSGVGSPTRIRRFRLTVHAGRRCSREVRASGCQRRAASLRCCPEEGVKLRGPERSSPLTREHERAAPAAVSRHRALLSTRPLWIRTGYEVRFAAIQAESQRPKAQSRLTHHG